MSSPKDRQRMVAKLAARTLDDLRQELSRCESLNEGMGRARNLTGKRAGCQNRIALLKDAIRLKQEILAREAEAEADKPRWEAARQAALKVGERRREAAEAERLRQRPDETDKEYLDRTNQKKCRSCGRLNGIGATCCVRCYSYRL